MSTQSASSLPPTRRKPLRFMDEHGTWVDFLHEALQVEQTNEFIKGRPSDCRRMTYEAIKRKKARRLRKNEASYVGLLFLATLETLLKKGWVYAEHEASGEFRKIFSKELPWSVEDRFLVDRQLKKNGEQDLFIFRGMALEGMDQGAVPTIIVRANRCDFEIASWNGIHFTQESKTSFESEALAVPVAPAQDEVVPVDLWTKLDPNDAAWIERQIRILYRSFANGTFPFDIHDLDKICRCVIPALAADNKLLEVGSPVSICGAVHGDFIKLRNAITIGKKKKQVRATKLVRMVGCGLLKMRDNSTVVSLLVGSYRPACSSSGAT
jgi:hypothetical protein